MLTLARKTNETIWIGEDIQIRVKRIDNDTVKIGIEAPKAVVILRGEVHDEMKRQNQEAARKLCDSEPNLDLAELSLRLTRR